MQFEFHFDPELDLYRGTWSGQATERSLRDAIRRAVRETDGAILRKPLLHIIEPASAFNDLDLGDLGLIREHMAQLIATDGSFSGARVRAAFVVQGAEVRAVVQLWQSIVEAQSSMGREVRAFDREEDAIAWLTQPRDSGTNA